MNKSCHIVRCKSICCVTKNADGVLDHFYEFPWFSPILGNVNICTQVLHKNLFQWSVKPALSSITSSAPILAGRRALQKCWQLILSENERDLFPSQGHFRRKVAIFFASQKMYICPEDIFERAARWMRIFFWSQKMTLLRNEKNETPYFGWKNPTKIALQT